MNEKYFNVKINYSQQEEDKALEIMPCYVTQFTPDELVQDREKKLNDKNHTIYFRKFVVKHGMQEGF